MLPILVRHIPTLIGAAFAAGSGALMAAVLGGVATATIGDFSGLPTVRWVEPSERGLAWYFAVYRTALLQQPIRAAEILVGMLAGAVAGGCLAYQDKVHKQYALGLFTRIGLVASGIPLLRLGVYQTHWPTAFVFVLLGCGLFLIGSFLVLDIALQIPTVNERFPRPARLAQRISQAGVTRLLTFVPAGLALLLFGAYFQGGVELRLTRIGGSQVDTVLDEFRWLGLVRVRTTTLHGLHDSRFDSGVVLMADSGEVKIQSGLNDFYAAATSLDEFLDSTRPALTLRSEPRLVFLGASLVAVVVVWAGFGSHPVTGSVEDYNSGRLPWQVFESPQMLLGIVGCAWGVTILGSLVPAVRADMNATPLVTAANLSQMLEGQEVLIEGRVSEQNDVLTGNYVLYHAEGPVGAGETTRKKMTLPFWIELNGSGEGRVQRVRVINDNYAMDAFDNAPVQSQAEIDGVSFYCRGYARGSPVLAIGRISHSGSEPQLRAWWLYGGTYADYVEDNNRKLRVQQIAGVVFLAIGLTLLVAFIGRLR